ncbi:gastric triacylglycerol lipase-like [Oppia nitens]|uniref:gastric triacylglycerol lipase-like n=1 Tax=Oppia nitens TaxID=1686743 RepID=UPI0023D9E69A|nr:gastric triacylglycerol lipase-like [Oppia nitens]
MNPELIKLRGFNNTNHTVITGDGYILTVFRLIKPQLTTTTTTTGADDSIVQPPPSRGPVLLWHGLAVSSDIYLVGNRGQLSTSTGQYSERNGTLVNDCQLTLTSNLAFTLSACGYDVWLGNTRGNQYSDKHLNQSTVGYVGHSMGSTIMLILLSIDPDYHQYLKPVILMAPVAYMSHTNAILRTLIPLVSILSKLIAPLGLPVVIMQFIATYLCANSDLKFLCQLIFTTIVGYNPYINQPDTIPVFISKAFQFMSTKLYLQYGQFMRSGRFGQFDYDLDNILAYGQLRAPDYPVKHIRSPYMAIYRGWTDLLADGSDIDKLVGQLNDIAITY